MPSKSLPTYLRTYRKRTCLSQKEVAFLLGSKDAARISRYERSKQAPSLRTLIGYELLFRTPDRELYGGVSEDLERTLRTRAKLLIRRLMKSGVSYLKASKVKTLRAFLERGDSKFKAT